MSLHNVGFKVQYLIYNVLIYSSDLLIMQNYVYVFQIFKWSLYKIFNFVFNVKMWSLLKKRYHRL